MVWLHREMRDERQGCELSKAMLEYAEEDSERMLEISLSPLEQGAHAGHRGSWPPTWHQYSTVQSLI